MRILGLLLLLVVSTSQLSAQRPDSAVLIAVAREIALDRGRLLGTGPNVDSTRTRYPHRVSVSTETWCFKGPGQCLLPGANELLSQYRAVAQVLNARLTTDTTGPSTPNISTYNFSEIEVRGDSAFLRVFMGWADWVAPGHGHIVTALFVVVRGAGGWNVVWRGLPGNWKFS